jgi:hypothetical protein
MGIFPIRRRVSARCRRLRRCLVGAVSARLSAPCRRGVDEGRSQGVADEYGKGGALAD